MIDGIREPGRDLDRGMHLQAQARLPADTAALKESRRLNRAATHEDVIRVDDDAFGHTVRVAALAQRARHLITHLQQLDDAAVRRDGCAVLEGTRDHRARHGLLHPSPTVVELEHAGELDRTPSELGGATLEHGRRRRWRGRQVRHCERLLDFLGIAVERLFGEVIDAVCRAPIVGQVGGQPVPQPGVDLRAAADTATFGERDRGRPEGGAGPAVAVLEHHLVE